MYLIDILGTALYNEINDEIVAGSVSTDNANLIRDYINDVLLYYVVSEGISLFTYKVENKSVVKKNSDNSQPIDNEEVAMLRDDFKNKGELFAQRLTNYLLETASATKYAAYLDAGNGIDTIHPLNNNYTSNWVLDSNSRFGDYPTDRSRYDN